MRKKITLALLSMLLVPLAMMAQSVTVDPSTGKLVAVLTNENETGFDNGWSGMWRHEQLPMTLTVSDNTSMENGQFSDPANNMLFYNDQLLIGGGQSADSHWILSLPKGYRFKGYKMVVLNNLNSRTISGVSFGGRVQQSTWWGGTYNDDETAVTKVLYETNSDFNTANYKARGAYDGTNTYEMPGTYTANNPDTREYVITRMSGSDDDMGNVLYFRLAHSRSNNYYGVTIKSFTVYFTAEGTFEAEVKPGAADVALSLVRSPFKTNKIDIGKLKNESRNGKTYFAYTYTNVRDIDAHTYIYQSDAVASGVPMNVASKKKIHPVTIDGKQYFAFENGVYYVESPTQVYSQTGLSYPIGYRIVGAKFTPLWGSAVTGTSQTKTLYYITYTSEGQTYYLNDLLHFTTTKFGWNYDSNTHNVYVGSGNNAEYLACEGSEGERRLTLSYANGSYYNLEVSGTEIGWPSYGYYLRGTTDPAATVYMTNSSATNDHAQVSSGSETVTMASYSPGAYTLNIYDKTGTSIVATKTVSSASAAGTAIELKDKATYGYNNDAIKFEISGLPTDGSQQALVDVSVFMQALNPYIDQMNIVCHDNAMELSQPFDAENFRVSGGQIKFNVPSGTTNLTFSFKDLYSQYGDNTYYTGTSKEKDGYARYSFVTSPYFYDFNELKGDGTNDGSTDVGLYDTRYVGTASNPQPGAALAYTTKVYASTAGNIRFKFNNAENLSNEVVEGVTKPSYLEEYPFSVTNYIGSANPDGGSTTGAFVTPTMNVSDTESSTFFVFTADETRYNIAPSYNWQHRYYAFYRMEIDLQTDTYVPQLTWTKVYDETCYNKNGSAAYDAMWGLKLRTVKQGSTTPVEGYLTVKEIDDAISAAIGKNDCPATKDQILYVDAGDLHTIQSSTVTSGGQTTTMNIGTLQQSLSKNVMIYLPSTITSEYNNCAKKPSDWSTGDAYHATRDIVLTDNVPFYAPYDIFVDVDKSIIHERKVTVPKNGQATSASIIMPFDIQIDGSGKHTNLDGQQFTLHQMASSECLTTGDGADYVYFPKVSGVSSAPANKPYLVQVIDKPAGDQISFVLSQKGGTIKATTGYVNEDPYKYTYVGQGGTGSKDGVTYTFVNHGSYSGKALAKNGNFFYYWKNQFVRSNDYAYEGPIKIAPFRAYYTNTTPPPSGSGAKTLNSFDVLFDDGNETDGIMMNEYGTIDVTAPVYDLQGRKLANSLLDSSLGKGVYVINGVKIIIK